MRPEWIWLSTEYKIKKDVYAGFKSEFLHSGNGKISLKVSSDSNFAAYINGKLVGFSNCSDYPHYKLYDEIDITDFCNEKNELYILVWHYGDSSQTYIDSTPGLWFEISDDEKIIDASSPLTLGRLEENYKNGYCKIITTQLGYSYYYDNTFVNEKPYLPCVKIEKSEPSRRPQKNLLLAGRVPVSYTDFGDRLLVDLGKEVAGYLDLDFESPTDQELLIAYGEHLETGRVLRLVGGRDFSVEFKAKKGQNTWFVPLRRLGCRYLEICYKNAVKPNYIGINEVLYPVTEIKREFDDNLIQKIYDTSVRTLRLCMHEHYEDTPWREQALYALDSRNQMLFGYQAFKEHDYARSNILLINQGLREDGLLSICFPAGRDIPIPFFSIAYILALCEYVEKTADHEIYKETEKTAETIIATFKAKIDGPGLIPKLPYPYWNFYEWSKGNDGNLSNVKPDAEFIKDYDLILNAFFVYVIGKYNKVFAKNHEVESIKNAIHRELYNEERGMYKISANGSLFGQLGNAIAVLAGLGDSELIHKIAKCEDMTPATLSMKPFVYDALLVEEEKYKDFVLNDIKSVYKKMLDCGATSFWETERGWSDFSNAGSLCHGWSASPVYYLTKLIK